MARGVYLGPSFQGLERGHARTLRSLPVRLDQPAGAGRASSSASATRASLSPSFRCGQAFIFGHRRAERWFAAGMRPRARSARGGHRMVGIGAGRARTGGLPLQRCRVRAFGCLLMSMREPREGIGQARQFERRASSSGRARLARGESGAWDGPFLALRGVLESPAREVAGDLRGFPSKSLFGRMRPAVHRSEGPRAARSRATLQALGGAKVALATAPSGAAIASLIPGLGIDGQLVIAAAPHDAITIGALPLIMGAGRSRAGTAASPPTPRTRSRSQPRRASSR